MISFERALKGGRWPLKYDKICGRIITIKKKNIP